MFSDNQLLQISGNLEHKKDLENAIEFAVNKSEYKKSMRDGECNMVFRILKDGRYCFGYCYEGTPNGWKILPFKYDPSILAGIIKQYLDDFPVKYGNEDGSYCKGFLMETAPEEDEDDPDINMTYGIVAFRPYTCFYGK